MSSNPLQSAQSALLTAPVNLWVNGAVQSDVQLGGITYNSKSSNPFFQTLLGDVYINAGNISKAAAFLEMFSPLGTEKLSDYIVISEEVDPLRPIFETVSISSRFGGTEQEAQGNVLSNTDNAARNLIRTYFPNAFTTLQAQRNGSGVEQSNPDNNNIYCLIGMPEDYLELLPGQTFYSTATAMYYVTEPKSINYNRWVITDGTTDATNSPTSLASTSDTTDVPNLVNGAVYSRVPYTYETLTFERFVDQDATDILARRRIGIFRRLVNYVTAAAGTQIALAKSAGIQPLGELINAGWGTDSNTPNAATRTTRVTSEVLLPAIPVGTRIVRGQANDGEASTPKVPFGRVPIPQDHFCMITRYGLSQTTDVAAIVGEHEYQKSLALAEAMRRLNNGSEYSGLISAAKTALQSRRAFSDVMFNIKADVNGFGVIPDGISPEISADLLASYMMLRSLQSVQMMTWEKGLQLLFGAGKLQNPVSSLISNRSNNFAGLVYNPNRVARGTNGIGVNGQPLNGGFFDDMKFGSYSQGLLRSVPVENTFDMPAGNFDFTRFADIMTEWQAKGGANSGYMITDGTGAQQFANYFLANASLYRMSPTITMDSYTGISIREFEYAGMQLKVVVLPELTWGVNPQEQGTYTFINFGTESNANVRPFYVGTPMALLRNEQQNGKLVNSIGARVETGLVCRGFKYNAFRIRRNV